MKVYLKHGKVTQHMHGASRNYRYVWDVSIVYKLFLWWVAVTPQKSGYRFLCCYSLPTFPSRKISPGYRLTTGKIQMMLGLATSSPALVASHDPFSPVICPGICENVATICAMCCIST